MVDVHKGLAYAAGAAHLGRSVALAKEVATDNYDFLRKHIARALELAEHCTDPEVAKSLREMATESQRVLEGLVRAAEAREDFK